jgi:hypothetical protein
MQCYYDYSTGEKILISCCYGSLHDRPEYCTCEGGVIDEKENTTLETILKLSEDIKIMKKEILMLKNSMLDSGWVAKIKRHSMSR